MPKTNYEKKETQPAKVADFLSNRKAPESFPIIGIGASAGGLEALDAFLKNLPLGNHLALVVIQHLAPTLPGMMVELLQRSTPMEVLQAVDRQVVKPGHIYVIPPGKDLSILRGKLYLFPPSEPRGRRLPIDFFFQSLAQDLTSRAIGLILSGMGSDGLLGAKAIKGNGGQVLVQEPTSAAYDGMPNSVIRAGIADRVATPAQLAVDLMNLVSGELKPASSELGIFGSLNEREESP